LTLRLDHRSEASVQTLGMTERAAAAR